MQKLAILFPVALALAASQNPVFRSDTRVVEVAIVARDANNAPISDLRKEDLHLFDNGVEQAILSFDKLGAHSPGTTARAPRLTVILMDALNTSFTAQVRERKAISAMLKSLPRGDDRIAIFALGETLHPLHDFSANLQALRAAVDGYAGERPHNIAPEANPFAAGFSLSRPDDPPATDAFQEERIDTTLQALLQLAKNLKEVPGEKNLLWITAGFPPPEDHSDFTAATRALAAARVMLYPVDARGLLVCPPPGPCPWINDNINGMEEAAQQTGGRAFHDGNDLAAFARAALDDSREGYLVTFKPTGDQPDGSLHEVRIKITRKGLYLRYRPGYIADPAVP